ncbi:protein-export chaperone SecB [Albibacterium profundi]|uniref:Protein-export chaperone SecB n=1 Tax=Albibacterium profundi TaxID=3134906 RepID=A0ABV5C9M4_9SPHI
MVQFTDVNLTVATFETSITSELKTSKFEVDCLYNDEENKHFATRFNIELFAPDQGFRLHITAIAHFESDEKLTHEFLNSDFTKVNAPAIAFPYVRTFISNLTLNAGYSPVYLPSFNFVSLAEEKRAKAITAAKEGSSKKK